MGMALRLSPRSQQGGEEGKDDDRKLEQCQAKVGQVNRQAKPL